MGCSAGFPTLCHDLPCFPRQIQVPEALGPLFSIGFPSTAGPTADGGAGDAT